MPGSPGWARGSVRIFRAPLPTKFLPSPACGWGSGMGLADVCSASQRPAARLTSTPWPRPGEEALRDADYQPGPWRGRRAAAPPFGRPRGMGLTEFPGSANYLCAAAQSGRVCLQARLLRADSIPTAQITRVLDPVSPGGRPQRRGKQRLVEALAKFRAPAGFAQSVRKTTGQHAAGPVLHCRKSSAGRAVPLHPAGWPELRPVQGHNMSLNSFVTRDGGEMVRAHVLQAQACRLSPTCA